ncbi:LysR family transcriptional regulator [Brevibacillus invocatus]|nr:MULTISPECIES: LysR family transcriptional regulator [Brevibacillus]
MEILAKRMYPPINHMTDIPANGIRKAFWLYKLCITQSNLSQQIKFLENELELPLFDRIGKRITLTDAGKILLEQSHVIFEHVDYAKRAVSDLKRMEGGRLDIGILPGDGDLLFDALLIDFHKTYPKLSISVTETTDVYEQVLNGTRDLGVTTVPLKPDESISIIPLFHEEFALAIRSDHPLAKSKTIPFDQLQQKLFITELQSYLQTVMSHASRSLG